jgi:dTMP kinase
MEQESTEFYEQVREAYRELAAREPNRIVLIDGSRAENNIENEIWEIIARRFPALATNLQSGIQNSQS